MQKEYLQLYSVTQTGTDVRWTGNQLLDVFTHTQMALFPVDLERGHSSWPLQRTRVLWIACIWRSTCLAGQNVWSFKSWGDLGKVPTRIRNQALMKTAKFDARGDFNMRIYIKYHLVRDLLKKDNIEQKYCPTTNVIVYILSKPLAEVQFENLQCDLGFIIYWQLRDILTE